MNLIKEEVEIMDKKYLNEEKYQKNKKTIMFVAVSVLLIGILIGGALIATGIMKLNFPFLWPICKPRSMQQPYKFPQFLLIKEVNV